MKRLFVDTSGWFAYVNAGDPDHRAVVRALDRNRSRLVTSNFVLDETVTLCARRLGHGVAVRVGEVLLDPDRVDLVHLTAGDESAAWSLFRERSDKSYSFTDCTSFSLMNRLGISKALTLDEHFRQEGFDTLP